MKVEIWSDVMCPFCYIGKRNFETALDKFGEKEHLEVVWKSFQLDPSLPETAGETYEEYLAKRKGMSREQVRDMFANVKETAKQAGLDYDFDKTVMVNSHKAHELIQFAKTRSLGNEAEEILFKAFFTEGRNIADTETLIRLGEEIGLDKAELQAALSEKKYADAVNQDIQEARKLGVNGVPFFVMDRKYAVSGAQPPEVFLETLEKAYAEWKKLNPGNFLEIKPGQSCSSDGQCV